MKKQTIYIIIAIVVVLLLIIAFRGSITGNAINEGTSFYTVKSDDGLAELQIPKSSLPKGIDLEDVSIKPISNSKGFIEEIEGGSLMIYELQPNGLQFDEDITFQTEIDAGIDREGNIAIPILLHTFGEDSELVEEMDVTLDLENGKIDVSAKIDHFSNLYIGSGSYSFFNINAKAQDADVGQTVYSSSTVNVNSVYAHLRNYADFSSRDLLDVKSITIEGKTSPGTGGILTPFKDIKNKPSLTSFEKIYSTTSTDYSCKVVGKDYIEYATTLRYNYFAETNFTGKWKTPDNSHKNVVRLYIQTPKFQCKGKSESSSGVDLPEDEEETLIPDGSEIVEEETTIELTYNEAAKMTPPELNKYETIKINALIFQGNKFPFPNTQFVEWEAHEEGCNKVHFHGSPGFSIKLESVEENSGDDCGWHNNLQTIEVTPQQLIDWFHNKP